MYTEGVCGKEAVWIGVSEWVGFITLLVGGYKKRKSETWYDM